MADKQYIRIKNLGEKVDIRLHLVNISQNVILLDTLK